MTFSRATLRRYLMRLTTVLVWAVIPATLYSFVYEKSIFSRVFLGVMISLAIGSAVFLVVSRIYNVARSRKRRPRGFEVIQTEVNKDQSTHSSSVD